MTARCLLRATARQTKVCTSASSGHIIGGSIRLSSLRAGVTAGPASSSSSRSAHGRSPFRVAGSTAAAHLDLAASWFLRPLLQDCCSAWRAAAARPGRCTIQNAGGLPLGALQQSRLQHRCTAAGIPNITHTIYTWSGSSCRSISSNTHTNTSSSSSSDPSQPTPLQQAAAGSPPSPRGPYREGYGGKVAIPSQELLQQPLLSSAATVRARAYHIGGWVCPEEAKGLGNAQQSIRIYSACLTTVCHPPAMPWLLPAAAHYHCCCRRLAHPHRQAS